MKGTHAGERRLDEAPAAAGNICCRVGCKCRNCGINAVCIQICIERSVLASQTSLNTSATNAALAVVNLYKSLGGGWEPDAVVAAR